MRRSRQFTPSLQRLAAGGTLAPPILVLVLVLVFVPAITRPGIASDEPGFPFPAAFTSGAAWEDDAFLSAWTPQSSPSKLSHRTFTGKPVIFGHEPHFIIGLFHEDKLASISIAFLDSGTFHGYVPRGADAPGAQDRQKSFDAQFATVLADVTAGIRKLSGARGETVLLGKEPMLRREVLLFRHGDFVSRLTSVESHLVKLTLYRSPETARAYLEPAVLDMDRRDLEEKSKARLSITPDGDHLLEDIPLFPQGNRAYCGVSTLAMTMQYLGLNLDTEDYAAAAGIQYGSARDAEVREVYHAAAKEAGMRMTRSTKFDFDRARKSIDAGIPVMVWRRFSFDRDYIHSTLSKRFATDKTVRFPEPDLNDRATWPGKDAPNHASVITGYHPERKEVIFTESWGEYARNRRMRAEEMEGTAYYTFYLSY